MTYKEALDFMYSQLPMFHRIGKEAYKANLNNTFALDEYFDHPHQQFPCIHIGGTNGKGSTSHMIASIFQAAGFKTGLYTSPHLLDFRERIRINGEKISENNVVDFLMNHISIIETVQPSFFEMTVAMAFDYFRSEHVDIAIIEVGMGGRLDSTNIITPKLSIITNISYDHKQFLGDTLEKIALEKAGIIKPKIPAIIGEKDDNTMHVFNRIADENNSKLVYASEIIQVTQQHQNEEENRANYLIEFNQVRLQISCDLLGLYQEKNIQTVYAAFLELHDHFHLTDEHFKQGLHSVKLSTGLAGRWDIVHNEPIIICDTGHNEAGIIYITNQLKNYRYQQLHMVIGAVNDKEIDTILDLLPKNAKYYFVQASIPRALDSNTLSELAWQKNLKGSHFKTVEEGYNTARKSAASSDLIFIGGSTFVVADFLQFYKRDDN